MKYFFLLSFLFIQLTVYNNEKAVIVNITEFARFPELKNNSDKFISELYKQLGSHFPIQRFDNSKDGTKYFPSLKNIKREFSAINGKSIIYMSTHSEVKKKSFKLAVPESTPSKKNFVLATDFKNSPSLLIVHSSQKIDESSKISFMESFKNFNGAAVFIDNDKTLNALITIYKKPLDQWRNELIQKVSNNQTIVAGRLTQVSEKEVASLRTQTEDLLKQTKKLGAEKHASQLYSGAVIKLRLSKSNKESNQLKEYFKWQGNLKTVQKCQAVTSERIFAEVSNKSNLDKLEVYNHPEWKKLQKHIITARKSYKEENFSLAAKSYEDAIKKATKIHSEIVKNLISTIEETNNFESSKSLIKSLIELKPELKLRYGFSGLVYTNSKSIRFAYIPSGSFTMGSPESEDGHEWDEKLHKVTISKNFYMSQTEVTEDQFRQVMGMAYRPEQGVHANDNLRTKNSKLPARVSWQEAVKFCQRLSKIEDKVYRLPTEAEWEYAARANASSPYSTGNTISSTDAITKENSGNKPSLVAQKSPNTWGLYDMHGNVWEWCSDWSYMYDHSITKDPSGPSEEFANENELDMKIVRGGSWEDPAIKSRCANRWEYSPSVSSKSIGFRIVLELQK